LFIGILFGTWYKSDLFSLILHKKTCMYVWFWTNFYLNLKVYKKLFWQLTWKTFKLFLKTQPFTTKTWNYGNILDFFIINVNVYWIMCISLYINTMFYLFDWTLCLARSCCVRIGIWISFKVHWTYDDWTFSFMKFSCDFFVCVYIYIYISCDS